ncbi:MAG: ABC transporter ATP-binding protein [Desulfuromonadales bacterium]|nr:ABC transporter ATP-binding protein [Desulfuromonadales bacterium]
MNNPLRQRLSALLNLHRAWRLVWSAAPAWTAASLLLILVQGLLPLVSLYLLKELVDALTLAIATQDQNAFWPTLTWVGLLGLAALVSVLTASVDGLVREAQNLAVNDQVAALLHRKSVAVDLAYYEDSAFHDTLHLAQQEALTRPARIVNGVTQSLRNLIMLTGIAGLLFSFHWAVGLALFVAALPAGCARLVTARQQHRFARQTTEAERKTWYHHVLLTSLEYAREIRLLGLGRFFLDRDRETRDGLRRGRLAISRRRVGREAGSGLLSVTVLYLILAAMTFYAVQGALSLGVVVMYFQGYQRAQAALNSLLQGLGHLYEDHLFLDHLHTLLTLPNPVEGRTARHRPATSGSEGLVCQGVTFTYPQRAEPALHRVDLRIKPGEIVALVGLNGAGKSTLVKLVCGLYAPQQGTISWQGQDLNDFQPADWRRLLSVVSQDAMLFDTTVAENIGFGDIARRPDADSLLTAARQAGAADLIASLPTGLQTALGLQFAGGHELSIGERQRLTLARACFRHEHQLLILDEPSSALDPLAEAGLIDTFRDLLGGRSALIVSHRLSTIRLADTIYVFDGGRVVEQGCHAELADSGGLYSRLYRAQAESYRL